MTHNSPLMHVVHVPLHNSHPNKPIQLSHGNYRLEPIVWLIINGFKRANFDEPCYVKSMLNIKTSIA